mmetsp:Transcript_6310/g.15911  ORF Transcript_6310/g.15911 Transcript_6310/m.15911 type:complete len:478 (+) Transcript_6310:45-1478(+)
MPPKKGGKKDLDDGEEVLQAVLIADSFQKHMSPITYSTPKCLLPLVNVPMIEYTLEMLTSAGVKELFIVCCSHGKQIDEYISKSQERRPYHFVVHIVEAPACKSMGAAMREVDARGKIRGDFILVHGDVVSTVKLEPVLAAHKERREKHKNKDAILTMVLRASQPTHRNPVFEEEDVAIAVNPESGQLLHYQSMRKSTFTLDTARFEAHPNIQVRYDVEYIDVCVCSPEVLCLFTDEFDWLDFSKDFLPGVLTSEILSYQIYTHVSAGYAGKVNCLSSYSAVSRDIVHRWAFPLVPEVNLLADTTFKYHNPNIYKETNVTLAQSCTVGEDSVFGSGTSVGDGSTITQSIIGRNVSVGANSTILRSFILDGVTVGDNVRIVDSLVCADVMLGNGVVLSEGCVIAAGARIMKDVKLGERVRIAVAPPPNNEDEDDDEFFEEGGAGTRRARSCPRSYGEPPPARCGATPCATRVGTCEGS